MKSGSSKLLPARVQRSLSKFGHDLGLARRKRGLTIVMAAERVGVSKGTYLRIEKGDPTVATGAYATVLFVLGMGTPFDQLADPGTDEHGLLLDEEHIPKRVRPKKMPTAR